MCKVIIVEDEMLVRLGVKSIVNWEQLELDLVGDVSSGKEALDFFIEKDDVPDIVITDIHMPGMDGMELIKKVRETGANCKFVILTCLAEFDLARKALSLGVSDYVMKFDMTKESIEKILVKLKDQVHTEQQGKKKVQRNLAKKETLLKDVLRDYLLHHACSANQLKQLLMEENLVLYQANITVVSLFVHGYARLQHKYTDENGGFVNNVLLNVLDELILAVQGSYVIHERFGQYILVFSFEEDSKLLVDQRVYSFLEHMKDTIQIYFNVATSYGISRILPFYENIPILLKQSQYALEHKYFWDIGKMIRYDEISKEALIEKIKTGLEWFMNEIHTVEMLKSALLDMFKAFCSHEEGLAVSDYLKFMHSVYMKISAFYNHEDEPEEIVELIRIASECESSNQVMVMYKVRIQAIENKHKQHFRYSNEVHTILQYIKDHYMEDISLESIASQVGYSPNYLSMVFKREYQVNLFEYINGYRIERAKELMETTNLYVYEIARLIGFTDESYFSRIFKKYTGIRPNEYKRVDREKSNGKVHRLK